MEADWSSEWIGWNELSDRLFEEERNNRLESTAMDNIADHLRRFLRLVDANSDVEQQTETERSDYLERVEGLRRAQGQVWGRNDCCADSLLQLLVSH